MKERGFSKNQYKARDRPLCRKNISICSRRVKDVYVKRFFQWWIAALKNILIQFMYRCAVILKQAGDNGMFNQPRNDFMTRKKSFWYRGLNLGSSQDLLSHFSPPMKYFLLGLFLCIHRYPQYKDTVFFFIICNLSTLCLAYPFSPYQYPILPCRFWFSSLFIIQKLSFKSYLLKFCPLFS